MKRYLRHPVVQNALALYSVQIAEYLLPMITIPYLARVLEPAGWGVVVYAQNFAWIISMVTEYGFGFSASREIARNRDDAALHAELVSGVVGANLMLFLPALLIALGARFTAPEFRSHPGYLWLAVAAAMATGFKPFWYFQGIEKMRIPALLNLFGRLLYTVGIFVLVRSQSSGWVVLALQASTGVLVTILLFGSMYRRVSFQWPTMAGSIAALKAGWTIFFSRSATSLYTLANTFILGFFTTAAGVAYYGGSERVIVAVVGLMAPITQALYPRMSHLAASNREKAKGALRMGLIVFGIAGLITGALLIAAAPLVVRILLGKSYLPAIPVMRVASLIVPFVAITNILGMQWMLAFGMDKEFNRISLCGGALNVVLAVFLSSQFGPVGTAWSVVVVQAFVTASMFTLYLRSKKPQLEQSLHS
jgi:PST family polysaccharide transporter